MATEAHRITVGTTPALLNTAAASAGYIGAYSLLVRNRDAAASVFIGGPAVTAAAGFELLATESMPLDLESGENVYAIAASGTVVVHVLEVGT